MHRTNQLGTKPLETWRSADREEALAGWLFILPAGVLLLLFLVWPAVQTVLLSFTDYQLLAPLPTHFVGGENYRQVLRDGEAWRAARTTITFAALAVPLQTGIA